MKKQSKGNTIYNVALIVAIVGIIGWWSWKEFRPDRWYNVNRAVDRIAQVRDVAKARETLRKQNDRQYVLDKLHAALDDDDTSIDGKIKLLETLAIFKDNRTVRLAVESKSPSTRRAAVWLRYGDPAVKDVAEKVVLDWLEDTDADARGKAVMLARNLKLQAAVPALLAILDEKYTTPDGHETVRQALAALAVFKPKGLSEKLMAIARDTSQDESIRGEALNTAASLDDAPHGEIEQMALDIVKDKQATTFLRVKALGVLRRPSFGSPKVWDALEAVLLDTSDEDAITQRGCLNALGTSAPLDQVKKLLYDRRVYRHPYFAVRIDVATALAALNMRERRTLQILNEYLVDEDPKDRQHQVRQEGYLSLYVLTGIAYGIEEKDLFQRRVRPIPDPQRAREYIWRSSFLRPGITQPQAAAVQEIANDLATMKRIKQTYEQHQETILKAWEDQAKAAEKKNEGASKDDGNAAKDEPKDGEKTSDGEPKDEGQPKDGEKKDEG